MLTLEYNGTTYHRFDSEKLLAKGVPQEVIDAAVRAAAVPQSLTPLQLRMVLHRMEMLDTVAATIAGLPEPQKGDAEIAWEYATAFERHHPFIGAVAQAADMTDEEIDALFVAGAQL